MCSLIEEERSQDGGGEFIRVVYDVLLVENGLESASSLSVPCLQLLLLLLLLRKSISFRFRCPFDALRGELTKWWR